MSMQRLIQQITLNLESQLLYHWYRQEKENSRKERAQARLMQQQQQQQAPAISEAPQEKVPSLLPTLGTPRGILKGASFFGNGRHQAAPNGTAPEPRTHYRLAASLLPVLLSQAWHHVISGCHGRACWHARSSTAVLSALRDRHYV